MPNAVSPAPGLQKQPVRNEMLFPPSLDLDRPVVNGIPVPVDEIERDGPAAVLRRGRTIHAGQWHARAVPHAYQVIQQPTCQTPHAFVDDGIADGFYVTQTDLHSRDVQVIHRAIFKTPGGPRPGNTCPPVPTPR